MFRHYLDSPEQGLLMLTYWGDVGPRSGGTFIAPVRPPALPHPHLLVPIRLQTVRNGRKTAGKNSHLGIIIARSRY